MMKRIIILLFFASFSFYNSNLLGQDILKATLPNYLIPHGGANFDMQVSPTPIGGPSSYTFKWSSSQTTKVITASARNATAFSVVITDKKGKSVTVKDTIKEMSIPCAYYDVVSLVKLINKKTGKFDTGSIVPLCTILSKYYPMPDNETWAPLKDLISKYQNVELSSLINEGDKSQAVPVIGQSISAGGLSPSVQPSSGNLLTYAIQGTANFLIDHAKEEMYMAFFQKIKSELDSNTPELKVLFPNTTLLIDNSNSWDYSNILNTIKESFNKDLQGVLGNIPNLDTIKYIYYKGKVRTRIDALHTFLSSPDGRIFLSAVYMGNGFISGQKIPDVINTIADNDHLGGFNDPSLSLVADSDIQNSIKLLNILSYSFRSDETGKNYVSLDNIKALFNNKIERGLYFDLICQQISNQNIRINGQSIATIITKGGNLETYIKNLMTQADDVTTAMTNLENGKKKGEKDLSTYWSAVFASASQFLTYAENIESIDPILHFPKKIETVLNYSTQTLSIAQDIAAQNYNASLVGLLKLVSSVYKPISSDSIASTLKTAINTANTMAKTANEALKTANEKYKSMNTIAKPAKKSADSARALEKTANVNMNKIKALLAKAKNKADSTEAYTNIEKTQALAMKATYIYDSINTKADPANTAVILAKISSDLAKTKADSLNAVAEMTNNLPNYNSEIQKLMVNFTKYVSFASNVVSAKSPTDIENAIESIALPVGSYSVKRNSNLNIAINGYIGGEWDVNLVHHFAEEDLIGVRGKYNLNTNLYAPVGISISRGGCGHLFTCNETLRATRKCKSSLTLFIPLIDVGGIANFSMAHNDSTINQKITLANIFSPGAIISYGIPTLPVAVSFGIIYKPELIYQNDLSNVLTTLPGLWRYNLSVLIDIPIINIWNIPEE